MPHCLVWPWSRWFQLRPTPNSRMTAGPLTARWATAPSAQAASPLRLRTTSGLATRTSTWTTLGGANSDSTMKAFQSRFGLTADGCVGPNTWNVMRSTVYSACSPGYACNLPNYSVGITNGSGQIVRQSWFSRSNCDWGSYIQAGINTGPIAANTTYDFSSSLSGGIGWCA